MTEDMHYFACLKENDIGEGLRKESLFGSNKSWSSGPFYLIIVACILRKQEGNFPSCMNYSWGK